MRVVVDTNVLIAALLTPGRTPSRCLTRLCDSHAVVLVDPRLVTEYQSVVSRPKFSSLDPSRVNALYTALFSTAVSVTAEPYHGVLIDDGDRPFIEVALSGRADVIITGNTKHFPQTLSVEIVSPAQMLLRLG